MSRKGSKVGFRGDGQVMNDMYDLFLMRQLEKDGSIWKDGRGLNLFRAFQFGKL